MAADELEPVEAGAVVMAMSPTDYSLGFWNVRENAFAAGLAMVGGIHGAMLVAFTGGYSLNAGTLGVLGLGGAIWLSISWIKRKRAGW